jgi:hypothetical protein
MSLGSLRRRRLPPFSVRSYRGRTNGEHAKIPCMARRPDREKAEILSEKDLKEHSSQPSAPQRASRSELLRTGVSGLSVGLYPPTEPKEDADTHPSVEASVEVALNRSTTSVPCSFALPRESSSRYLLTGNTVFPL